MINTNTFSVPDSNLASLIEKLATLQKRASKLHTTPISWRITGQELRTVQDYNHNSVPMVFHRIEVTGDVPVLNGWRFVAAIDHVSVEDGNVITSIPGTIADSTLAKYRQAMPVCEHCKLSRARNTTYLLQHKDGMLKQVGKTCLKDFTRTENPLEIAKYMEEYFALLEECAQAQEERESGGRREYIPLEEYCNHVAAAMRTYGWISTTKAYESSDYVCPTKRTALNSFMGIPEKLAILTTDKDRTVLALAWVHNLPENERETQFMYNLYIVCKSPVLAIKHAGIAAALFVAYDKAMQVEYERKQLRESIYLGQIGDKITCTVQVTRETPCEGAYGVTYLYSMIVEYTGSSVKWFASKQCLKVSKRYQLTGIVKAHEEYKGVKQTVFTRCKAIELS